MATVNEQLRDETVAHSVSLQQYSLGVVRRMVALLNRVDADLSAALILALDNMPAESYTDERMELLLASVRTLNAAAYDQVSRELQQDLGELSGYETQWQSDLFDHLLPDPVKLRFPLARVTAEQAYAAAMSRPFQGRLLKDWSADLAAGRMAVIRNAIRTGYLEGKTVADIVRGIRGTKTEAFADGFLARPRRDLESVVRAAVMHTASTAREQFYKTNESIVKALQWVSTLDTKTSDPCRIRDHKNYTADTKKPIGHKVPWLQGPGKLHWNCRSTDSPVTKSWRELGIPVDEMTPAQRASMDGMVPADQDYSTWLSKQSAARQERVLGPARYRMIQSGEIKMGDLYTPSGEFKTIDQLKGIERVERLAQAA
jgi:hypothetical protein